MNCLFLLTSLVNIASVTSLVVLLIWSSTLLGDGGQVRDADRWNGGDNYGGQQGGWNDNGGGNSWDSGQQQQQQPQNGNNWWTNPEGQLEFRMDRADRLAFKLVLDLAALILVNVMVAGKSWSVGDGGRFYEKANLGSLSGSMYMLANMLLVSFLYLLNFSGGNRGQGEYNYNRSYSYMDKEERLSYHENTVAWISLALAVAYFALSFFLYRDGDAIPEAGDDVALEAAVAEDPVTSYRVDSERGGGGGASRADDAGRAQDAARIESLSNAWGMLTFASSAAFAGLFAASLASLLAGGGRAADEGRPINEAAVLAWLAVLSATVSRPGRASVDLLLDRVREDPDGRDGTLGVGLLTGTAVYFAVLLFTVFALFVDASGEGRGRDDAPGVATASSVICFVLGCAFLAFGHQAVKYKRSLMRSALEDASGAAARSKRDFVRRDRSRGEVFPF